MSSRCAISNPCSCSSSSASFPLRRFPYAALARKGNVPPRPPRKFPTVRPTTYVKSNASFNDLSPLGSGSPIAPECPCCADPALSYATDLSRKWKLRRIIDDELIDSTTTRNNMARLYFTNEATRLMAKSKMEESKQKKVELIAKTPTPTPLPPFLMDRIKKEAKVFKKERQLAKVKSLIDELDSFDDAIINRSAGGKKIEDSPVDFDPSADHPTSKSLLALKQKMEAMKIQREREVNNAMGRYRGRKAYFRQMLPHMDDLERDILDYTHTVIPIISEAERKFLENLDKVSNHKLFDDYKMKFDPGTLAQMEYERKTINDAIEVVLESVIKTAKYKAAVGEDPPHNVQVEWRKDEYLEIEKIDKIMSSPEILEAAEKRSKIGREIVDVLVDLSIQTSDYKKVNHGEEPSPQQSLDWRTKKLAEKFGFEIFKLPLMFSKEICESLEIPCPEVIETPEQRNRIGKDIIDVLIDIAIQYSDYKTERGEEPTPQLCLEWRIKKFSEKQGYEVIVPHREICSTSDMSCPGTPQEEIAHDIKMGRDILEVLIDAAIRYSEYKEEYGKEPPAELCLEWRTEKIAEKSSKECFNFPLEDDDAPVDDGLKQDASNDVLEVLLDVTLEAICKAEVVKQVSDVLVEEEVLDVPFAKHDLICFKNAVDEEDFPEENEEKPEDIANDVFEVLLDVTLKTSGYKAATDGLLPRKALVLEWMSDGYCFQDEMVCEKKLEEAFNPERIARHILEVLLEVTDRISEYKLANGGQDPPQYLIEQWRNEAFESITIYDVVQWIKESKEMCKNIDGNVCSDDEIDKRKSSKRSSRKSRRSCLVPLGFGELCPEGGGESFSDDEESQAESEKRRSTVESIKKPKCFTALNLVDSSGKPISSTKFNPSECPHTDPNAKCPLCESGGSSSSDMESSPPESLMECLIKLKNPPVPPNTSISDSTGFVFNADEFVGE